MIAALVGGVFTSSMEMVRPGLRGVAEAEVLDLVEAVGDGHPRVAVGEHLDDRPDAAVALAHDVVDEGEVVRQRGVEDDPARRGLDRLVAGRHDASSASGRSSA